MADAVAGRGFLRLSRPKLPPAVSGVFAVLGLLPRVSTPLTICLAASVLVSSALPLGVTIVAGLLVGSVPAAVRDGLDSPAGQQALTLLGVATLFIIVERLLGPLQGSAASVLGRQVDRYLQERTMSAVGRPHGVAHLEDPAVLDLIESARGVGLQGLKPGDAVAALASLIPSWAQALGSAAILVTFQWWLGVGWLLMWPVLLYYLQREYLRVGETAYDQAAAVRRADYYRDLALRPTAAKEVRVWGLPDWLTTRYDQAWRAAMEPIWKARSPGRAVLWLSTGAAVVANLTSFGLLAWSAIRGDLTLAALAVYTQATLRASTFRAFDDQNMILSNAAVAVPRALALGQRLNALPAVKGKSVPEDMPRQGMRFQAVEFRYPGLDRAILRDLDLDIPAGRSLAIVGENGAGKTTLVKLICRLYEPTAGRIEVDSEELSHFDPVGWHRRVAAIFQDFARYHMSARDNVAMGAPWLSNDLEKLRTAASRAGALELIESLPNGWDTVLSREYAGGVDLSGGQWQRIALARAMFAVEAGAKVLILDEPTASLDVRAEAELYDRFLEITEGLTTILISHRFSTVRRADRIVVLEGGRVTEEGSHQELMSENGRYAAMFRVQAERFVEEVNT
ncbi:MAG: ABC transporter ATP-binding protein/permease [Chloroflexota bacterium]|nr:ABC transporter ATP-binding protein/permease [Chloroflexota bacterium]